MVADLTSDSRAAGKKVMFYRYLIFAFFLLGYFYCSVQRISSGVVLPHMAARYGYSASLVGFISSLFFYTYGFLQSAWGAVNDRVGPMKSCSVGLFIAGLATLMTFFSHHPLILSISRLLCGLGLACLFTGIYLYVALAFPLEQYATWVGVLLFVGNLGTVAAVAPLGALLDRLDYAGTYLLLSLWALFVAGALWIFRNCSPPAAAGPEVSERKLSAAELTADIFRDIKKGFVTVFGSRALLVVIFAWTTPCVAGMTLQGLWGVSWLEVSTGVGLKEARFWTTLVSIGMVLGAPIGARILNRTKGARGGLLGIMFFLCFLWVLYLMGAALGWGVTVMGGMGFLIGLGAGAIQCYCSSTVKSLADMSHAGLVIGTGQLLLYSGVIIGQWGSGIIIDCFPSATAGLYQNVGYILGFGVIVAFLIISTLLIFTIPSLKRQPE